MSSGKTLLQAALSHLDLALMNICEQARNDTFRPTDQQAILKAASMLTQLASQRKQLGGTSVAEDSSEHFDRLESRNLESPQQSSAPHSLGINRTSIASVDGQSFIGQGLLDASEGSSRQMGMIREEVGEDGCTNFLEVDSKDNSDQQLKRSDSVSSDQQLKRSDSVSSSEPSDKVIADMIKILMDAFYNIDEHAVHWTKLQLIALQIGLFKGHVHSVFAKMEKTHDGLIYPEEWSIICKRILALHSREKIIGIMNKVRIHKMRMLNPSSHTSSSRLLDLGRHARCVISYKSPVRMAWDLLVLTLLVYVGLALPLTLAFDNLGIFEALDSIVDCCFALDILFNFFTTYMDEQHQEVWDRQAIQKNYLKSWFVLDLLSSLPLDHMTSGMFPRNPTKLLKFGKIAKAAKMIRLSKVARLWSGSEVMERLEELAWEHNLVAVLRGLALLLQLTVSGHWLACLLLAVDGEAVETYVKGEDANAMQKYIVALYWSMMTMTTVGYGDVPMVTYSERLYATVAMIIGGASYGYIIGVMTTLMQHRDADQRACAERMDVVVSWLRSHIELPPHLRKRVWRHFREFLTTRKAVEDSLILNDLPPQLRKDVSLALLQDSVRHNPLFSGMSTPALSKLVSIMSQVKFRANEVVVDKGDTAKAMFVIDRGFAQLEKRKEVVRLSSGDSFGEEVLLLDVPRYTYSVRTHSKVSMFRILRDDFTACFKDMPADMEIISSNYYRSSTGELPQIVHVAPGSASLLTGGPTGLTAAFPEVVLSHFTQLMSILEKIQPSQLTGMLGNAIAPGSSTPDSTTSPPRSLARTQTVVDI